MNNCTLDVFPFSDSLRPGRLWLSTDRMRVFYVTAIPLRTSPGIVIDDRQTDGRTDGQTNGSRDALAMQLNAQLSRNL